MALDLSAFSVASQSEAGYKMPVLHPVTKQPFDGVFITVRGNESPHVQKWVRSKLNARQQEEIRLARMKKQIDPLTIAEAEDYAAEAAAVRIMGWDGIEDGGKPVPFTHEAAVGIFKRETWLRDQVLEAAGDLGNFVPA